MLLIPNEPIAYYDVDGTLIEHHYVPTQSDKEGRDYINVVDPYQPGVTCCLKINKKHTNLLTQHYKRGYAVVVWSAAGARWAKTIVEALNLQDSVNVCITKPHVAVDDLPAEKVLSNMCFLGKA